MGCIIIVVACLLAEFMFKFAVHVLIMVLVIVCACNVSGLRLMCLCCIWYIFACLFAVPRLYLAVLFALYLPCDYAVFRYSYLGCIIIIDQ